MKIRKIGLAANVFKEDIRAMISSVVELIPDAIELIGLEELSGLVDGDRVRLAGSYAGCDAVIALGGDGTILRASRAVEKEQIPLLGLKMRSLGFLAEDDPGKAIGELLRGECIAPRPYAPGDIPRQRGAHRRDIYGSERRCASWGRASRGWCT